MKKKVVIAMSGGVDSSVSAYLLNEEGYEVVGLFMNTGVKFNQSDSGQKRCCSAEDSRDARCVAGKLNIKFYALNFKREFDKLIAYFCEEYNVGRTPNPCIVCNQRLKFGRLKEFAESIDADYVATGHYAKVEKKNERFILKRGKDRKKEQSYFLFSLNNKQLEKILFPLGNYLKTDVRKIAKRIKLNVKEKPESQEICFVPDNDYSNLIRARCPQAVKQGEIVDLNGNVLGTHPGIQFFTIGQRRGIKLALGKPKYVVKILKTQNKIVIGDDEDLFSKELVAENLNWISIDGQKADFPLKVKAKIRYRHEAQDAEVQFISEDKVKVVFEEPVRAVTPGQAVVFYDGDVVVGGGWIVARGDDDCWRN